MAIAITGRQDLRTIGALQGALADAIGAGGDLALDLGGIESADLAFVQLIESARREAERAGVRLALAAPAQGALREVIEQAGLLMPPDRPEAAFWTCGDAVQ
ncbi:MAG: STAS domain-containing protein [Sphingomonadales bacterium]|nr:STAS domain-containing protein [Sphingomonadales bacterium]